MKNFNIELPSGFRNGTRNKVKTVSELIAELKQLPPEMKVLCGCRVTVTNYNDKYLAVVFEQE